MRILGAEYVGSIGGRDHKGGDWEREIAFVGRSNVGKSSMINALVMQRVAKTSSTPGATRMINLYKVRYESGGHRDSVMFADFPGFGYSKVSKATYEGWEKMVEGYLSGSRAIRHVVWVFDVRRELDALDVLFIEWMAQRDLDFSLILTKSDKEGRGFVNKRLAYFRGLLVGRPVFVFSARSGEGKREILTHLFSLL
jgi:GTP-binding protein